VIARDSKVASIAPAPRVAEEPAEDVLDLAGSPMVEAEEESAPLLGEHTRASMRESLAALAMMAEPPAAPQIVRAGETSLEGLTRELLRPALTEWLDRHLPPLVERMVADEIARIVGKKG
jgi:cell pole-organizing protein PopZ